MKIIGLHGLPRSGKDTFANYMHNNYGYRLEAFAAPLKAAAAVLLNHSVDDMEGRNGFDREAVLSEWGFSTREFLQKFGTECLRNNIRQDFWIQHMRNRIVGLDRVIITDVRFQNEADLITELGGKIVLIERPGCIDNGHVSNQRIWCDAGVSNDKDLETLYAQIEWLAGNNGWRE